MFDSKTVQLDKDKQPDVNTKEILDDPDKLKELVNMMKLIAKEALVEPKYDDIEDVLTQEQIQTIFEHASGGVKKVMPIDAE